MTGLLVGLGCFAMHAIVSLAWLRLSGRMSPVARLAVSALGTHVLGVVLAAQRLSFPYWPAAAVSGFAAVGWLFAFSAVYKSVSLRILTELSTTPGGALPLATITDEHVRPEFLARAELLVKMDCAAKNEGSYTISTIGRNTARRIVVIQRACGIAQSGMYRSESTGPNKQRAHASRSTQALNPPTP